MAVELCQENCGAAMSPRISFSYDFCHSDVIPVEQHPLRSNSSGLNSNIDFDFCFRENSEQESSSADELFSDGRILPTEVKKKNAPLKQPAQSESQPPLPQPEAVRENSLTSKDLKNKSTKDNKFLNDEAEEIHEKQSSKSFWRFKRSSSCGSGYGRSLCPLPLLSRSYSTGSTQSVKRVPLSKEGPNIKLSSQKHASTRSFQSFSSSNYPKKPPLKKSYGPYGIGVRVSPILNVPSANLFGLGSVFSNTRDRSKRK